MRTSPPPPLRATTTAIAAHAMAPTTPAMTLIVTDDPTLAGAMLVGRAASSTGGVSRTRHGGVELGSNVRAPRRAVGGSRYHDAPRRRGHFRGGGASLRTLAGPAYLAISCEFASAAGTVW